MHNRTLHPDTSENGNYLLSVEGLISDVLFKLDQIAGHRAPERMVEEAVYAVIDGWLANRMIWADPVNTVRAWCQAIRVEYADLPRDNKHVRIVSYIEHFMGDLLLDILPNRTWRMLSIRKIRGREEIIIELGEDYRISDWMNRYGSKYT